MNRLNAQRGFAVPPWLIIGLIVLVAAWAAFAYVKGTVEDYGKARFAAGEQEERAKWLDREQKQLREHAAEVDRLRKDKDAAAAKHLADLAAAHSDHEKRRAANEADKKRFMDDVRAGRVVLRDPGAKPAACPAPRGGEGSTVDAALVGGDGAESGRLSLQLTEFLFSEAARADAIVDQLKLAQDELRAMYEACKNR
jgi:hypothetical protein